MRFDGPDGSIDLRDWPKPPRANYAWPREDARIAAIKALVDSAPTYAHGAPKTPEAAIIAAIRKLLKETR